MKDPGCTIESMRIFQDPGVPIMPIVIHIHQSKYLVSYFLVFRQKLTHTMLLLVQMSSTGCDCYTRCFCGFYWLCLLHQLQFGHLLAVFIATAAFLPATGCVWCISYFSVCYWLCVWCISCFSDFYLLCLVH